jgi:hypothetical protein
MSKSKTASVQGKCAFCSKAATLRLSHIASNFAFLHAQRLFGQQFLSHGTPGDIAQQAYRRYMLCHDCEQLFGTFESAFARDIYHPFMRGIRKSVAYDERVLKLAVSLAWRTAHVFLEDGLIPQVFEADLRKAAQDWHHFLDGTAADAGKYRHYVQLFDLDRLEQDVKIAASTLHTSVPKGFYSGVLGGLEPGVAIKAGDRISIYVVMAGCVFWTDIVPSVVPVRAAIAIEQKGQIDLGQQVLDLEIIATLMNRQHEVNKRFISVAGNVVDRRLQSLDRQTNDPIASQQVRALRKRILAADLNV